MARGLFAGKNPEWSFLFDRLHLQNAELYKAKKKLENKVHKGGKEFEGVAQFGFHTNTCCGYLEMDNTWKDDWQVSRFHSGPPDKSVYLKIIFLISQAKHMLRVLKKLSP